MTTATATPTRTIPKVPRPTIRRCFHCLAPRASHECREGRKIVHRACAFCAVKFLRGEL